ncbi:hypothetical protein BT96DRAFT_255745 [Gymnopus androsaceus JB14]|uniref:Uncharacterized protein n=1 Tax=Gymnopus androsaceus JB14 TaxID=1447944 RepID=A0A6A4H5Q4_9AGAR|nr:hypothetical protein BT96DRAFT_255745 [Gymnopus androsaceus JB14]
MEDNWYEAAVSAIAPHRIISVVDWASDAPIPVPETPKEPASYNVFAWGVNDSSVGNRSIEKENFDGRASPVGWHSLPFDNDPPSKVSNRAKHSTATLPPRSVTMSSLRRTGQARTPISLTTAPKLRALRTTSSTIPESLIAMRQ